VSDACCGPEEHRAGDPESGPEKIWQVRELQLAGMAAVVLLAGWLLGRFGYEPVSRLLELAAVLTLARGRALSPALVLVTG